MSSVFLWNLSIKLRYFNKINIFILSYTMFQRYVQISLTYLTFLIPSGLIPKDFQLHSSFSLSVQMPAQFSPSHLITLVVNGGDLHVFFRCINYLSSLACSLARSLCFKYFSCCPSFNICSWLTIREIFSIRATTGRIYTQSDKIIVLNVFL